MPQHRRVLFGSLGAKEFLSRFWPGYATFVNGQRPEGDLRGDWVSHRRGLERVLRGERPLHGHTVDVPLALVDGDAGVRWAIDGPVLGPQAKAEYRFALMLLGLPEATGLLRRCDHCQAFFLGTRAHLRKQSFCSAHCRYASFREHRDKAAQAAYMRRYRRLRVARSRALKKRPR